MAPQLPPPASPPAAARRRLSQQRSPSQQRSYSVSVSASTQASPTEDRDRAFSARRDGGRLRRRLQVDSALGDCTTITITYSAESSLESISDEIDSLSAQAASDNATLAQLDADASAGCEMTIDTRFSLVSTTYVSLYSIQDWDLEGALDLTTPISPLYLHYTSTISPLHQASPS